MGRFVYGDELNNELIKLVQRANKFLFFVSPYIKLSKRLKDELKAINHVESLNVMVLFGKNRDDVAKSLPYEDLTFFQKFPNVDIRYEPQLHAKYYGNESTSILTSMNLYDYSIKNNIESGTVYDDRFDFGRKPGSAAFDYFQKVFENAERVYSQCIEVKSSFAGLRKQYGGIRTLGDQVDQYYGGGTNYATYRNTSSSGMSPQYQEVGYCIRTGEKIAFDVYRPLSDAAYRTWSSFGNADYPENYCHYSGERSNGQTCYNKPVLQKYWKLARVHT